MSQEQFELVADLIADSTSIWIGAGAGMGVDSGLPDFRGDEGFWKAYPPYRNLDIPITIWRIQNGSPASRLKPGGSTGTV